MGLIKKPSELEVKKTISLMIYGQPGIGKTTLGCSAPNAVLFDYDGGVGRINGAHRVPTLQVASWEQTDEAIKEIKEELPETQTIVIDTVGKMLDYMSDYIVRTDPKMQQRDGSLSLKGYGVRKNMFVNFVKKVSMLGMNVVFIAHEREDRRQENGQDKVVKRPEVGGSSANDLIKELDLVGYMQAIGKKRTITFDIDECYYAKNTCNLPKDMVIPVNVDDKGEAAGANDFLCTIIDKYEEAQKKNIAKTGEYEKLVDRLKKEVAGIKSAEQANAFMEVLKQMDAKKEHIYNSRLIVREAFSERVKELNLTFNKEKSCYEPAQAA